MLSANQTEDLDYARLARFFVETDKLPEEFIAALCLVDGTLAREESDEWLIDQCSKRGLQLSAVEWHAPWERSKRIDFSLKIAKKPFGRLGRGQIIGYVLAYFNQLPFRLC